MTTLQRTIVCHRRAILANALAFIALAVFTTACSGSGAAAKDPNAPVLLGVTEPYITVENRAGMALSDVTIDVVAYNGLEFTTRFPRMENAQRREISFAELSGRDGTQFNPRFAKPKVVRLRASDVSGKQYEIETAWK